MEGKKVADTRFFLAFRVIWKLLNLEIISNFFIEIYKAKIDIAVSVKQPSLTAAKQKYL